jgi:hypothetical protein
MEIAFTLVHNLGALGNVAQITTMLALITPVVELIDGEDTVMPVYDLTGTLHRVRFYQVVPFGVTPPANLDELNSHKVFYRAGDEDKVSTHPRFYNWGLKRSTDYGAQAVVHITDPVTYTTVDLELHLTQLRNSMVFREPTWGKVTALRLLRDVGQLDERLTFADAMVDLRARIDLAGLGRGQPVPLIPRPGPPHG